MTQEMVFRRDGKPYAKQAGACTWCLDPGPFAARDHVFPRSLGGTLELAVPSCKTCDGKIQNVEGRSTRSGLFAPRRVVSGPSPGHRKNPASGVLDAHYTFAPDPDGGFNDVRYVAGKETPITLPSFQFDAESKTGKIRYAVPEDVDRLVAALLKAANSPAEAPAEIELRPVDTDDEHHANQRFLPRISLALDGKLVITARSKIEVESLITYAVFFAKNPTVLNRGEPTRWEVPGGTPHLFKLVTRPEDELRIVSKIALGAATCLVGGNALRGSEFDRIRAFVADAAGGQSSPARRVLPGKELEGWPDHHLAIVVHRGGLLYGVVCLYGLCYDVELAQVEPPEERMIGAAVSRRDGRETFLVSRQEARKVLEAIERATAQG